MCVWVCSLSHKLPSKVTTFQEVVVAAGGWRKPVTDRERERSYMTSDWYESWDSLLRERLHQGAEKKAKWLNLCVTETERERKQSVWVWKFVCLWVRGHTQCVFVSLCCCVLTVSAAVSQSRCSLSLSLYTCLYLSSSIILPLPRDFLFSLHVPLALSCCCVWLSRPQVKPGAQVDGCPVTGCSMPAVRGPSIWRCVWREQRSVWRGRDSKHRTQPCSTALNNNFTTARWSHTYLHFKGQGNVLIFDLSLHVTLYIVEIIVN